MSGKTLIDEVRSRLNGPLVVLAGGRSAEREISLRSGNAVLESLQRSGLAAELIDTADSQWMESAQRAALVFVALHGPGGEDGTVQGALQCMGLRYTGSGVLGSAIAMDKLRTKLLWAGQSLPTPAFEVVDEASDLPTVFAQLGECIVKPVCEGSSIGMMRASSAEQLAEAVAGATRYGVSLAEKWVFGAEYTVAIVGDEALPAIRLETNNRFYDFQAKYQSNDTRYICPCGLGAQEEQQLQDLALRAFRAVGCSGWGRVDVMRDADTGEFQLLEVNTIPGMTDHSLVPMAARAMGWSFDELVLRIMLQAL
ncbi:D-alanine--D-alanine ligase [Litorivivens sp.]|uniref:D-alanine--D-alanine ligase n=1 Tax=Litorivivens sp. TaxID=2020868 RepID=UPI0035649627